MTATLTCPLCRHASLEEVPADRCLFFYECPACKVILRPAPEHCCVFCSYADRPCPSARSNEASPCRNS